MPRWVRLPLILIAGGVLAFVFALSCTYVYLSPSLPTADTAQFEMASLRVYTPRGLISESASRANYGNFERSPSVRGGWLPRTTVLRHSGSMDGLARALVRNVAPPSGQGGSTITQQDARNTFMTLDKTLRRKLSESYSLPHGTDFFQGTILAPI